MKQFPVNDGFDHNDKKYLCCCGHYHILTGASLFGKLMAFSLAYRLLVSFAGEIHNFGYYVIDLAGILCVVLLFIGIDKLNPRFVLPFVSFMVLGVISSVIIFIFSIIGAVFMNERIYNLFVKYAEEYSKDAARIRYDGKVQEILRDICITAAVIGPLAILFNYWLFNIVNRCYRYLKDYELHRLRNGSVALDGQQHIPPPICSSPPPAYA